MIPIDNNNGLIGTWGDGIYFYKISDLDQDGGIITSKIEGKFLEI